MGSVGGVASASLFPGVYTQGFQDFWSGAEISEDCLRALAVGAFYTCNWGAYSDTVALGSPSEDEIARRESCVEMLHESWGVDNADDALDTARRLRAGMHAPVFEAVHPLAVAAAADTTAIDRSGMAAAHGDFLASLARFRQTGSLQRYYDGWLQAIKLGFVDLLPQPLQTDTTAWDLGRSVLIVRAAHTAGYLDEDTAWQQLAATLLMTQRHYRTWRQFADGFLTGSAFWAASQDLSAVRDHISSRQRRFLGMLVRPTSVWRRVALHPGAPVFGPPAL